MKNPSTDHAIDCSCSGHQSRRMKRVLITNAYGPYPIKWGKSPSDLLGARLARDNDMDGRVWMYSWALYLLAENIRNPTTVLENPRWDDFIREVNKGYEVIAIQLQSMHMSRVARMIRTIRELSPNTEIAIGGNGVGMLQQPLPGDKAGDAVYIRENADHLCRIDGVRFMRELLNDHPFDRPITQYTLPPAEVQLSYSKRVRFGLPVILVSLGCPQACEFCNTSAFYHHKKIRIATASQVYEFMKAHQQRIKQQNITFILFDEDIFLDPDFVRELGRLIRSNPDTWGFRWISFGSMSTVSKFSPRELRECGVEAIWIGVESSIREDNKSKTGYKKREGITEPDQLFPELHKWGIQVIASMILGFDFHTPENIERDIDYFVNLRSMLYQIGPFRPCPGTELYRKMIQQERITDSYQWEDIHLWEEGSFRMRHLKDGDLKKYYDLAHEKLRTRNGSPVLQLFECEILSYYTQLAANTEFMTFNAQRALKRIRTLRHLAKAIELHAPSPRVKKRAQELLDRAEPIIRSNVFPALQLLGVRKAFNSVAPFVVHRAGLIGTVSSRPYKIRSWSPKTRYAYYNQRGEDAPIMMQADSESAFGSNWLRGLPKRANKVETRATYYKVISEYEDFWNHGSYAVVGHSAKKKFPMLTYRGIKNLGKTVYPIDPSTQRVDGDLCYSDFLSLPEKVDAVVIEVPRKETYEWVQKVVECGIPNLWIHMFADTKEAVALAREHHIRVLTGTCAVMYLSNGPSIHTMHKTANNLLGVY